MVIKLIYIGPNTDNKGQVTQAARCLAKSYTARVQYQVAEGWKFSSLLHVQTGAGST